ncbi:MlaD family protein [Candidatus Riflebacteria bacterium]
MFDRNEILAGGLVAISGAIFIGFLFAIVGSQKITGPVYYCASFKYAAGMEKGGTVRFGGFRVGLIDKLGISPVDNTKIQLYLKVSPGVFVNKACTAMINSTSALGENYIEITTGNLKSERIAGLSEQEYVDLQKMIAAGNGDKNKIKEIIERTSIEPKETTSMAEAFTLLREMADEIKKTAADMGKAINDVADKDTKKKLKEIVSNIRDVTRTFKDKAEPTMEDVRVMVKKAKDLVTKFKKIVSDNEEKISRMLTEFRDIGKNFNNIVKENRPAVKKMLNNLADSTEHIVKMLDNMAQMVEENRPDLKASITNLRNSLKSANQAMRSFDRMLDRNQENVFQISKNLSITTDYASGFMQKVKRQPYKLLWPSKEAREPTISRNKRMVLRRFPNPDYYIHDGRRNKSRWRRSRM